VASVSGGKLQVAWSFNREWHHRQTVERLLDLYLATLRKIASLCRAANAPAKPSDFPMARLNATQLQSIVDKVSKQAKKQKV
jgi:non-ribosomal peptide synthase protein (TIGR01720 family)